jgi:hypothetical protein
MRDPLAEVEAYERETMVLRLDEAEARALIDLLVLVAPGDPQKRDAVALADKIASEFFERFSRNLV